MNYDENNELRIKTPEGTPYLEESVLWYILPFDTPFYFGLNIHERINHKESLFAPW